MRWGFSIVVVSILSVSFVAFSIPALSVASFWLSPVSQPVANSPEARSSLQVILLAKLWDKPVFIRHHFCHCWPC